MRELPNVSAQGRHGVPLTRISALAQICIELLSQPREKGTSLEDIERRLVENHLNGPKRTDCLVDTALFVNCSEEQAILSNEYVVDSIVWSVQG